MRASFGWPCRITTLAQTSWVRITERACWTSRQEEKVSIIDLKNAAFAGLTLILSHPWSDSGRQK